MLTNEQVKLIMDLVFDATMDDENYTRSEQAEFMLIYNILLKNQQRMSTSDWLSLMPTAVGKGA